MRVAIVGGHDSVADVSGYDVVVRTNNHWQRQGGRIDALFHCGGPKCPPQALFDSEDFKTCKFIAVPNFGMFFYDFNQYCTENKTELFSDTEDLEYRREIQAYLKEKATGQPLTGIKAMEYYRQTPEVKQIFLTGMSLYAEDPERDACVMAHSPFWHAMYVRAKMLTDRRILGDKLLKDSIQSHLDSTFPLA